MKNEQSNFSEVRTHVICIKLCFMIYFLCLIKFGKLCLRAIDRIFYALTGSAKVFLITNRPISVFLFCTFLQKK